MTKKIFYFFIVAFSFETAAMNNPANAKRGYGRAPVNIDRPRPEKPNASGCGFAYFISTENGASYRKDLSSYTYEVSIDKGFSWHNADNVDEHTLTPIQSMGSKKEGDAPRRPATESPSDFSAKKKPMLNLTQEVLGDPGDIGSLATEQMNGFGACIFKEALKAQEVQDMASLLEFEEFGALQVNINSPEALDNISKFIQSKKELTKVNIHYFNSNNAAMHRLSEVINEHQSITDVTIFADHFTAADSFQLFSNLSENKNITHLHLGAEINLTSCLEFLSKSTSKIVKITLSEHKVSDKNYKTNKKDFKKLFSLNKEQVSNNKYMIIITRKQ